MATQKILDDIKRALDKRQPVSSADVRSLVAICESLLALATRQQTEIKVLKAAQLKPGPDPEPVMEVTA